ncbi:hypothetical protein BGZ65_002837 [Modicella reniformis]|uniref:Anaphase-promoting complex subunit 4-like WD40 domain-containing protein n=1 Tax=Modicella reniformis TaxID=1440133 RepID=A0A9P6SMB5_9FUNG|nr:hypothetical protein BGZ65_002837 [Modicella reniformis]
MEAFHTRPVSQRKRSHSTTAYSTSLLAAAVGSQVLTYEFISNQAVQRVSSAAGQYEAVQTSNERTEFGVSGLKWSPDNKMLAVEAKDGRIRLHDNRGQYQETLMNQSVTETSYTETKGCLLSWTPKSQRLYFANGNKVMSWDPTSRRTAETLERDGGQYYTGNTNIFGNDRYLQTPHGHLEALQGVLDAHNMNDL